MPADYYLAIDVEATGQGLAVCGMPCFGAALVKVEDGTVVARFLTHVKLREGVVWEQRCLDEFWLKPGNVDWYNEIVAAQATAPSREEAVAAFRAWVTEHTKDRTCCVILDTGAFDAGWVDLFLAETSLLYLLGKYTTVRDMSSFYAGVAMMPPCEQLNGTEEAAAARLGVPVPVWEDFPHDHRPHNDAANIALTAAYFSRAVLEKRVY